ncbi:hypothetical protein NKG05_24635 [Oerskovia sp. M15]
MVIGWRPGHGDRSHLMGSLLLAVPDDEGLRYVGRVGTGFTEKDRRDLVTRLGRIERATNPALDVPVADASDARWVTPHLVGEVDYADWTHAPTATESSATRSGAAGAPTSPRGRAPGGMNVRASAPRASPRPRRRVVRRVRLSEWHR